MEKSKKILKVENLKKAYYSTSRTGEIITYPVLNNVSFEIEEGEFVGIMGRSGCGKTTLLKAVGMLDKPDDGTIYYKDKDTKDIYRAELARLRRTEIAFVFQDYYLMDSLSIKENIMLPLILDEADVQESKKKCEEMAEKFAIADLLDKKPYELSGGEKQRTAICRALIYNPDLILADEPTGNLDSASSEVVIHTLEEINKKMGKTILLVTHDPIIASSCDRIIFLKDGKVNFGFFDNIEKINDYPEIESVLVKKEEYVLIVPKNHHLANKEEVYLSDLKDEYFIVQSNKECERSISYSELIGYTPKISVEPTEGAMLSSLVAAGAGIAIIVNTPIINMNKISTIKIKDEIGYKKIYMGWNKNVYLSKTIEEFKKYVIKEYKS